MEQRCYTGSHLTAVWAIGIPGIVLLCIGKPACMQLLAYIGADYIPFQDGNTNDATMECHILWSLLFSTLTCAADMHLQAASGDPAVPEQPGLRHRHVCNTTAGIPVATLLILLKNRDRLQEPRTTATYGFLYHQFKCA